MANYKKGDVNMDGLINQADLDLLTAYIGETATLTEEQISLADLNNDGKANLKDMNILYELVKSENAVFGFKKNGTKVEVPTKEDLDNLDVDIEINVIDNLTSTSTTDPLSANQGKVLNDKINNLNIPAATTIVDNLTSNSATAALSANQGRVLNEKIDNLDIPDAVTIVDNVTSTSATSALSANQGKSLNDKISKLSTDVTGNYYKKSEVDALINELNLLEFQVAVDTSNYKFAKYTMEKGMTWGEWVASSYNTAGFTSSTGQYSQIHPPIDTSAYMTSIFYMNDNSQCVNCEPIVPYHCYKVNACCFEAGTQVMVTLEGETKNIEDLNNGDNVVIYNINSKEFEIAPVVKLITKDNVTDVAEVTLENGMKVRMNAYHPILTTDGYHSITNYEGMPELKVGDIIITIDGKSTVTAINRYEQNEETMYNLTVDNENHNYIANGMVVHNAGCK